MIDAIDFINGGPVRTASEADDVPAWVTDPDFCDVFDDSTKEEALRVVFRNRNDGPRYVLPSGRDVIDWVRAVRALPKNNQTRAARYWAALRALGAREEV